MLKVIERSITLQLLIFYILFIFPLVLVGIELYNFEHDSWQQNIQRANLGLDQSIAFTVEANIQTVAEEATNLASTSEAEQLNLSLFASTLRNSRLAHPYASLSIVCDPSGKVLLTSPFEPKMAGEQLASRTYFQEILTSNVPIVAADQPGGSPHAQMFTVATRIMNHGRPVGVLIVDESLAHVTAQLISIQQQLGSSSEISPWIIDGDGELLADTHAHPLQSDLPAAFPNVKTLFNGNAGSQFVHGPQRAWLYSYVPIAGTTWGAVVGQPLDVALLPITSLQRSLLIALIMLIVGASLFWVVMHGWTVAPLTRLARTVTMIKPNQTEKATESKLIAKERKRTDEIGKLIAAFSIMEDEIHRLFRQSDEESQARLHTLDAIMQSMREGVLLESPDGHIVYANYTFTQFVGVSAQEILLHALNDLQLPEKLQAMMVDLPTYQEALQRLDQTDSAQVVEFQVHGYYNQMGQFIPVRRDLRMQLFDVRDQAGQLIGRGKIFNDVTMHNEAEQVKKNLLAIVSHELRTPLTAIKGYATSLLETDVELDSALQERFLRRIVEEGDRMAELVTNLLEMSQLEAGTLKLSPAWYHLNAILEQVVQMNEQRPIRVSVPADLPPFYVDRRRLEMVLRNLVDNAWCYGGPETIIEISAKYQPGQEGGLYLSVIDNGPGLPPQLTDRIFEHFYQVDGGRKRSSNGVGLGLAICRGFVEAHGGRIWAENRTDAVTGAIFHIWLPPRLLRPAGLQPDLFKLPGAF